MRSKVDSKSFKMIRHPSPGRPGLTSTLQGTRVLPASSAWKLYETLRDVSVTVLLLQLYNCSGCRHRYTGAERNVNARRQDNGSVPQSYFVARHNCVRCCQLSTHRLPWRPQLASVQQKWLIYLNDSQIDWSVFKV